MAGSGPILVVDDDQDVRTLMQLVLEDEGYAVVTAEHGLAALDAVHRYHPRLILLDLRMPVMDGWQFARAYRALPGRHAPIIVVTAGRDGREKVAEAAADAYIAKPFNVDHLVQVVAAHVGMG